MWVHKFFLDKKKRRVNLKDKIKTYRLIILYFVFLKIVKTKFLDSHNNCFISSHISSPSYIFGWGWVKFSIGHALWLTVNSKDADWPIMQSIRRSSVFSLKVWRRFIQRAGGEQVITRTEVAWGKLLEMYFDESHFYLKCSPLYFLSFFIRPSFQLRSSLNCFYSTCLVFSKNYQTGSSFLDGKNM